MIQGLILGRLHGKTTTPSQRYFQGLSRAGNASRDCTLVSSFFQLVNGEQDFFSIKEPST